MKFLILDHYVQDHLDFHVKKVHKKAEEKSGKEWTGKRDTCKRNPQYCDRCDRNFASDAHFLTHCKKVHNEIPPQFADRKQFKCSTCHEIFFNKYYLDRHKEKHDPSAVKKQNIAKKKVECPQCQKALTSNQKLKNHIKNMHGDRTVECPNCQKGFGTEQGRAQHLKFCTKKENVKNNQVQTPTKSQTLPENSVVVSRGYVRTANQTLQRTETQSAVDSINMYQL